MSVLQLSLYDRQLEFVLSDAYYLAFIAGIGSGKSLSGATRALLASQGQVGNQRIPVPNLGMATAPTYPMLRDASLRAFLELAGSLVAEYNKSESRAIMTNGSEILFRSTERPERLRGPNLSWWWADEASLYAPGTWQIGVGRLRQHGRGHAWVTTTPRGRNWVWQRFAQGKRGYQMVKAATWQNPFLDEDFIRGLMEEYTGDFARQELDGDFVAFEGLVYGEFDRGSHVVSKRPKEWAYAVGGIDHGWTNPGVMLVGLVDYDGRVYIVHEEYERRRRVEDWARVGMQLTEQWGVQTWYADPSEPDFIRQYNEAGMRVVNANNEVNAGIQDVKSMLAVRRDGRPRLTLAPEAVWTASEMEQYQWMSNREGLRDQVKKANDHAMDALRYLVRGVTQQGEAAPLVVETGRWA